MTSGVVGAVTSKTPNGEVVSLESGNVAFYERTIDDVHAKFNLIKKMRKVKDRKHIEGSGRVI